MTNLEIILSAKDKASKLLKKVEGRIDTLTKKARSLASKGLANIKAGFSNVANAIPALSAGIVGLGGLMLKFASDGQETLNRFNAVFGGLKDGANDFANSLASDTGRAISEVRNGMSAFQGMAVGLGFAEKEAFNFSKELQTLAIDFASFNNLSDGEAQERFIAAMSGSSEVLDQFGVNIKASALDQALLAKGFPPIAEGATEAQKAIARLDIIRETMGRQGAIGDAIKTGDQFANLLRRGRSLLINYAETIGGKLIPVGEELLKWLFKVLPSQEKLNQILDKTEKQFNKLVGFIQPAIDLFKKLNKDGAILNSILVGIAGTGLALLIGGLITLIATMAPVIAPFVLLGVVIAGLWYAWQTNFAGIQEITARVFTYIKEEVFPPLMEAFNNLKNWFVNEGMPAIQSFMGGVWAKLTELFEFFTIYILPALIETFNYVKETVMSDLVPAFQELWASIMEIWQLIEPYILPILKTLAVIIGALVVASVILLMETFKLLVAVSKTTVDFIIAIFKSLEKIFKGVVDVIMGIVNGDWNRVMSGFKDIGSGAVDFVVGKFQFLSGVIGDVVNSIGGVISSTGELGKNIGKKIPGFAVGTRHHKGGLAQINERGPEIVTLPSGTKIDTATASQRQRNQENKNITINFNPNVNFNGMTKPSRAEQEEFFENQRPAFVKFLIKVLKEKQII